MTTITKQKKNDGLPRLYEFHVFNSCLHEFVLNENKNFFNIRNAN